MHHPQAVTECNAAGDAPSLHLPLLAALRCFLRDSVTVSHWGQAAKLPGMEMEGKEWGEKGTRRENGDTNSGAPL